MKLETQEQTDVSNMKERQKWEALSGNYECNGNTRAPCGDEDAPKVSNGRYSSLLSN
jgi:hypothetical protein